jgi:hypothetical protein
MRYNGGAARSYSSFADPTHKNIQRFKAKLAFNRWICFVGRIGKTRAATGHATNTAHSG